MSDPADEIGYYRALVDDLGRRLQFAEEERRRAQIKAERISRINQLLFNCGLYVESCASRSEFSVRLLEAVRSILLCDGAALFHRDDEDRLSVLAAAGLELTVGQVVEIPGPLLVYGWVQHRRASDPATRCLAKFLAAPYVALASGGEDGLVLLLTRRAANALFDVFDPEAEDLVTAALDVMRWALQRKALQAALQDSRGRLELAQSAARLGLFDRDLRTGRAEANTELFALFGRPLPPTLEIGDWMSWVHPADQAEVAQRSKEVLAGAEPADLVFRTIVPDGSVRWLMSRCRVMRDAAGTPVRKTGIVFDITRMKQAEEALRDKERHLRLAQEAGGVGLWEWDLATDGVIRSGSIYQAWGLDISDGVLARDTIRRLLHPDDTAAVNRAVALAIADGRPLAVEFRLCLQDGSVRWVLARGEVVRDAEGRPVRMFGIHLDVTESHRMTEELARTNADLERRVEQRTRERAATQQQLFEMQKLETLGQLTGGVAHDFNNLLGTIIGNLEILKQHLDQAGFHHDLRRYLDGALMAADRGATLTQRLLAFGRRQDLQPRAVDVADLINGLKGLLEQSVGQLARVTLEVEPALRPALVDPHQLEMALLNLALNARDAMPDGGELRLALGNEDAAPGHLAGLAPGRYVRIAVRDTGCGMDPATLKRAIEPFFTTKVVGKGTGLGLSMVHGLAAQSGGALHLSSLPQVGTTATIWLPAAAEPALVRREAPPAVPTAPAAPLPAVILAVDDDWLILASTVSMLQDMGHTVLEAASGEQALAIFCARADIACVLTDYAMPDMNGAALARAVRNISPQTPVILVTGYTEPPDDCDPGLPRLSKPFRKAQLASCLGKLLRPAAAVPP